MIETDGLLPGDRMVQNQSRALQFLNQVMINQQLALRTEIDRSGMRSQDARQRMTAFINALSRKHIDAGHRFRCPIGPD